MNPMSRRFQFSLRRLLASVSAFCLAAAALTNGVAALREAKIAPFFVGWFVGWTMFGLGIWFLVKRSGT
jgi:hypothetical protein